MRRSPAGVCAVGVMAKAPQPGRSKTRLCPPLRPAQAAALSAAFLRDTVRNIAEAARCAPVMAYAAYSPSGAEHIVAAHLMDRTELILADGSADMPDGVEGFGRSLLQAIAGMLGRGHPAACVLSADSPTLPTRLIVEAARHLLVPGDRAVLGAAEDGGYYCLGLKAPHAAMFSGIAWSTGDVAETTRRRAAEIGLPLIEIEPWYDVDDAGSLARLVADPAGYAAPETRLLIEALDLSRPGRAMVDRGLRDSAA